jgi:ribosome maturation factor RimP
MSDVLDLRDRIHALADEAAASTELFVVDVAVRGQKGSRVIEVYADGPQGAPLDTLAAISRDLAFVLDAEDLIKGRYHLNVSSPGPKRALLDPRQWPQHIGRNVRVETRQGEEARTLRGTLTAATADAFTLEDKGTAETIPFSDVTEARIELPW